ncbi:hypothetical protein [Reticulibacter mediterranei]|nr:hypothetical protein [Reticulibacter mediterranei]
MTIPLSDAVFKVPRGYDDPWQRQQDQMHSVLQQLAPLTPDGGRHVLWRCPLCHQPWVEKNRSSVQEHLSPEQLAAHAFHVGIEDLERLPAWLCPTCSSREVGGRFRVERDITSQGYSRFVWHAATSEEVQIFHVMMFEAHVLAQAWGRGDLSGVHRASMHSPTDLLLSRAYTHLLLHMLMRLPQPETHAMRPLDVTALALEARRMWLPPNELHLRGYFWHPASSVEPEEGREDDLLLALVSASPPFAEHDPLALVAIWQHRFERLARLL